MTKKVILVTGASSGLGKACVDFLHSRGWTVVGASRRSSQSDAHRSIAMDVDGDESVSAGVSDLLAEHGQLDAVLACAGWGLAGAAEQTSIIDAKTQFETNFWGAVRVTQAVLPVFRRAGGGRVVLMSSIGGVVGVPFQAFYSASKFALDGYAESLAYEVSPFKIHISLIEPGNFKTGFTHSRQMVPIPGDDPYRGVREKAIEVMERDETNGADPGEAAKVVARVLARANPPRRVSVGNLDERVGIVGKRLLPFRLFEKATKGGLGV